MKAYLTILIILCFTQELYCLAKIMRNNALMNQMVSHFQKDNALSIERETEKPQPPPPAQSQEYLQPGRELQNRDPPTSRVAQTLPVGRALQAADSSKAHVLSLMQNVLCRNFPTIPCNVIIKDDTLRHLMERSIQQISYKKMNGVEPTPLPQKSNTGTSVINSEDLSSFLHVADAGYFSNQKTNTARTKKKDNNVAKMKNFWSHESIPKSKLKGNKDGKRTELFTGRKKLRKFYPHKLKYKDKKTNHNSEEKMSMSVEIPDMGNPTLQTGANNQNLGFKVETAESPVWRIDYMKHGEPSLNMYNFAANRLRGKIMQAAPNVVVNDSVLDQNSRKEVLHPDVYIKKKFVSRRKAPLIAVNNDGAEK